MHLVWAAFLCALLAIHGVRKGSLSKSGAAAAVLVGLATFTHPSVVFTIILLTFYLSSSRLTKVGMLEKVRLEEGASEASKRTAIQVLANGLTGSIISIVHALCVQPYVSTASAFGSFDSERSFAEKLNSALLAAYIAHYACCCGDTWASELGILSKEHPILITSFKKVPPGTNGGVSKLGLIASLAGGAVIGVLPTFCLFLSPNWTIWSSIICFVIGLSGSILGSLLDSILGATVQKTTYNKKTKKITPDHRIISATEKAEDFVHVAGYGILDNHQINFMSSLVLSVFTFLIFLK
ncbi:integral membrane protein DUF92-domain-containing protein [Chytridium lagenaria]|nr:integral membrane protein DUF92-domain-containing protein [Chytridium lagenaria]